MKMATTKTLFVVYMLLFGRLSADDGDRYSYDSKLLEKVIRLELKVEEMQKKLEASQERMESFITDQTTIFKNKTDEVEIKGDVPLVAFNAYSPVDVSPDTSEIIVWRNTLVNEGNGYDTVLGLFTAPVSGLYFFAVHTCVYTSTALQYAIILDHNIVGRTYQYEDSSYHCSSLNTITMVKEGQRVWVKCTSGSTSNQMFENDSYGKSSFIGVLLHK